MAGGFSDNLRRLNPLHALIAANAAVFLVAGVGDFFTAGTTTEILALPPEAAALPELPWTPLTYMFAQGGVLHLLFNMLWLYCFGRIAIYAGYGRRLPILYAGGGLAGAAVFLAACAMFPSLSDGPLIGSSAAVIAVAVAVAFDVPDMRLNVWPLGEIKIKWIVAAITLLFCAGITGTPAANAAHAGGAAFGALYGFAGRRKIIFRRKKPVDGMRAELDSLLDKVKVSGYDALSSGDKRRLFELSYKIKK